MDAGLVIVYVNRRNPSGCPVPKYSSQYEVVAGKSWETSEFQKSADQYQVFLYLKLPPFIVYILSLNWLRSVSFRLFANDLVR